MSFGYALTRALYVHGGALFQKTHGGLTASDLGVAPPDQRAQGDRLLKMRYWHLTGGLSYSAGFADLFFAMEPYVWGGDTHDNNRPGMTAQEVIGLLREVRDRVLASRRPR